MTIAYAPDGSVQLKMKSDTVSLGTAVRINSYELPGPGEYDVASVQVEAHPLGTGFAYLIRSEELLTVFLDNPQSDITTMDDASNCNILIVDVRSDSSADSLKVTIKSLEPSYVFLMGASAEFIAAIGIATAPSPLKITRAGLPLEGTTVIIP